MKVLSAEFVTSATGAPKGIPADAPQVALAGRSNVGKSSLINALCRRTIARTSAAPGKTRLANIYRVKLDAAGPRELYLVDLPGYGYARGGEDAARELRAIAEGYLTGGERDPSPREGSSGAPSKAARGPANLEKRRHVLLLIDSRHPSLESDVQAAQWLGSLAIDTHIVATKIDKLSRSERARNLRTIGDVFGTAALPVSAQSGEGLNELWQLIIRLAKSR